MTVTSKCPTFRTRDTGWMDGAAAIDKALALIHAAHPGEQWEGHYDARRNLTMTGTLDRYTISPGGTITAHQVLDDDLEWTPAPLRAVAVTWTVAQRHQADVWLDAALADAPGMGDVPAYLRAMLWHTDVSLPQEDPDETFVDDLDGHDKLGSARRADAV